MGRWASPRGDQFAATPMAPLPQFGVVIVGVTQHITRLSWQWRQPQGRHLMVSPLGYRQLRRQRAPHGSHRHRHRPVPAIPPAVPPGCAPPGLGSNRAMRDDPRLPMFSVPHTPAGRQRGALTCDRASMRGPGLPPEDQVPSNGPDQPRPAWRQGCQAALPRAAARKTPRLGQQGASLAWQGLVLMETRQSCVCRREAAHHPDDERLHDEPIGICVGPAPRSLGGLRRPGQPIDQ
jgi:hypothetical protein